MWPKTKNNMNFQPEETITDQSTLIVCEEGKEGKGEGGRGLIESGAYLRGGGLNRGFTVFYVGNSKLSSHYQT